MTIFKLQIWCFTEDGEGEWRDLYFDVDKIDGFFMANCEPGELPDINILFNGDQLTIKQEDHIVNYLNSKFVETSIIS